MDDPDHTTRQPLLHLTLGLSRLYSQINNKGPLTRYTIKHRLGSGAFATTYYAFDELLRKHVAIKVLGKDYTSIGEHEKDVFIKLQRQKARHFVDFYTSFYLHGCLHLALECLDERKVRLPECVHEFGHEPVSCPDRVCVLAKIAVQILSGLHELHSLGYMHADIKPENVMFVNGEHYKIKLIDLGNATRLRDTHLYHDDFDIQSVGYRAPEVLMRDVRFDARIDVWSVGVVLFELLLYNDKTTKDGRIVNKGSNEEVIEVLRKWFGGLDCYQSAKRIRRFSPSPVPKHTDRGVTDAPEVPQIPQFIPTLTTEMLTTPTFIKRETEDKQNTELRIRQQEQTQTPLIQQILNDTRQGKLCKFLMRLLSVDFRTRPSASEALRDEFLVSELLGTWADVLFN